MANDYGNVIYTGVTNDISRRAWEHKNKFYPNSFTARYNVRNLVYYEPHESIVEAISREKEIKGWVRRKKIELIKTINKEFRDLYIDLNL